MTAPANLEDEILNTPSVRRMPLMIAAMIHMLELHTPTPRKLLKDRKAPKLREGARFTSWIDGDGFSAVNPTRRARAKAARDYGLKPTGRQKVRFRRFMRANGSALFQRGTE